ncbi:hypothetical protein [Thermocatellispora tengchongensis]|uniref:hypothetical protein n=1 Tax=Thermocatellispora tengchongensis TaxID=1073253 RepID=UPI00362DD871
MVENLRETPMTVTVDVTVCAEDGSVLQRLTGVTVVATPDMRAKFAQAVRDREAGAVSMEAAR